jgi:hypothetical protein
MLSRYAVYLAGGFSFVNIFVNLIEAMLVAFWFSENYNPHRYSRTVGAEDWLAYVILVCLVASFLMSFLGILYGYDAGHKRWNAERLRSVAFSARLLIFLGSLNLVLGFLFQHFQMPLYHLWPEGNSMVSPLLWATGAFMILLSLPGFIIATRWLTRRG